ncbi:MAG: M28 family peptidase [Bacteroidales bacterium]|nr:M28 family peptidase [Bacteroidales bacterium]
MEELLKVKKRLRRKSKTKFLDLIQKKLNLYGYECNTTTHLGFFKSINLETKTENPRYIFVAHYDTLTIMPFWMSWLMRLVGINRQLLLIVVLFAIISGIHALQEVQQLWGDIAYWTFYGTFLTMFIPTPNNYDDNTSGVITLLKLARKCREKGIDGVKFLFVDNEELGLLGSSAQLGYNAWRSTIPGDCKVISVDCVGGKGEIPLLIRNSKSSYEPEIRDALSETFGSCESVRMILPASDNFSFRKYGAINISFVKRSIIPGGYAIPHIHSPADKTLNEERLDLLADTLVNTIQKT